jgi:hypothetical protein
VCRVGVWIYVYVNLDSDSLFTRHIRVAAVVAIDRALLIKTEVLFETRKEAY